MSIKRRAEAQWNGDLKSGDGYFKLGSGAYEGKYSFGGRTTDNSAEANPEELIGAALASCFSMAFSAELSKNGYPPIAIHTTTRVNFDSDKSGFFISEIDMVTKGQVPNITSEKFTEYAEEAKRKCPVAKALGAVKIVFSATLE
ncbi:MAG: OsmC family peroxiredoxin [Gammaproteobacteria bacterium]|nr:OsmC family peroxiredoxin [Gammaproteobacteria bacterium]MBY0545505.1 OsmC family peroxiredoxin [Gammaproteobacteria bacterium]